MMLAIAYYLLKVIICSGILYGYYRLALHNKIFHAWNRFYLLSAVVVSLLLPLLEIDILRSAHEEDGNVVKLLQVVNTGDAFVHEASGKYRFSLTTEQVILLAYTLVCLVLILWMCKTLLSLRKLIQQHPVQKIRDIHFVDTEAKGTPFSFFRYIFWNRKIDPESETGKRIFMHELVHVSEKHSADRLFMNLVLSLFWINPFFWLIRREMNMIHEFIADSKSVEDYDSGTFAAMVLQAAYPQHSFGLTSSFFSSSIKRRLMMFTKMKNKKVSYFTRIMVLPLLTFVFMAFAVKIKKQQGNDPENISLKKTITVVIDAGHGGKDGGAKTENGIYEKDINLSLAKKVAALNNNPNIKIILTRDVDEFHDVRQKVDFAARQNPDVFISLHVAAASTATNTGRGFEIFLSRELQDTAKKETDTRLLASLLTEEIGKTYTIAPQIKQRPGKGIWVLDSDKINYPSLIIECGYLTDSKDLKFIKDDNNQDKIAKNILAAIEKYASLKEKPSVLLYDDKADTGVTHMEALSITFEKSPDRDKKPAQLLVVNGKEVPNDYLDNKQATGINGMTTATIYKPGNATAIAQYGEKARNGAFILENASLKEAGITPVVIKNTDTIPRKVKSVDITTGDEVIVIYEDGKAEKISKEEAIKRKLLLPDRNFKSSGPGVQLRINQKLPEAIYYIDGAEATTEQVNALNTNDITEITVLKGESAIQKFGAEGRNGIIEITTINGQSNRQLNEIVVVGYDNKVYVKPETKPEFPGGDMAWARFISRNINENIELLMKRKSEGTCVVQFIIDTDGNISNVEALTMKNSQLAKVAIEAVKKGPKWIPATQNGKKVKAYHTQPVTFSLSKNS